MSERPVHDGMNFLEGAAAWDARLRSPLCSAADRTEFEAWCEADPRHREAFHDLQVKLELLQAASRSDPTLRAIRERVTASHRRRWQSGLLAASLAAAIVGGAGWAGWIVVRDAAPAVSTYATAAGEMSTVHLQDGSVVTLNSKTELKVSESRHERSLQLLWGQASFAVAHDKSRPFVVTAGRRQVVAVGTAFDVRFDERRLVVTMVEGKVKVRGAGSWASPPPEQELIRGQGLTADNNSPAVTIETGDLSANLLWREGKVVFDNTPLSAAVEEINRYTQRPIVIGDSSLRQMRVSGMFHTATPETFVAALTTYYPIAEKKSATGTVLVRE